MLKRHMLVLYIEHTLLDEKLEQLRMFDSAMGYLLVCKT